MARKYRVVVDKGICQGHSVCVAHAPAVFRTVDNGGPYPMVDLITDTPPEAGPGHRVLLRQLMRGGKVTGAEPAEAARARHREVMTELPLHALRLSRGYPAVPTVFRSDGPELDGE